MPPVEKNTQYPQKNHKRVITCNTTLLHHIPRILNDRRIIAIITRTIGQNSGENLRFKIGKIGPIFAAKITSFKSDEAIKVTTSDPTHVITKQRKSSKIQFFILIVLII